MTLPSPDEVLEIAGRLEETYSSPRHGNPPDPLDDLVYILLSNRTAPTLAVSTYRKLRARVGSWESLLGVPEIELIDILRPAGLARKRAAHLRGIIGRITDDFGAARLDVLADWTDERAEQYLCSLPGISEKVAKCVLMYTLGRSVLPVDVHVHRVTRRLGWHNHKRADQSHATLARLVPPELRYGFHVNCVAHGRAACRAQNPRCAECPLAPKCAYLRAGESGA